MHLYVYAAYYYQKAVALRPYDVRMWSALGSVLLAMDQTDAAVLAFRRADEDPVSGTRDFEEAAACCSNIWSWYVYCCSVSIHPSPSFPSMRRNPIRVSWSNRPKHRRPCIWPDTIGIRGSMILQRRTLTFLCDRCRTYRRAIGCSVLDNCLSSQLYCSFAQVRPTSLGLSRPGKGACQSHAARNTNATRTRNVDTFKSGGRRRPL